MMADKKAAAADVMAALKNNDSQAFADALEEFVHLCYDEPDEDDAEYEDENGLGMMG